MSVKARLAVPASWVLALALCGGASAQDSKRDQDNKGGRQAVESETIRGVISGVTIAGELAIDYRTRRAVEAETALLTVVGTPSRDGKERQESGGDDKGNDKGKLRHHRHNVYVLVLSPRTEVKDARDSGGKSENAKPSSLDELEVGDRVEVKFTPREDGRSGGTDQARRAKHGRHRTYFGDAMTITILPQSRHDGRDTSAHGEGAQDKDQK